MKSNKLKTVLSIIFLAFLFASCSKEDDNLGTVNISFVNRPSDLVVKIFVIENDKIPIYSSGVNNTKKISLKLNIGNYVLIPSAQSIYPGLFTAASFQITPNKTVNIRYDEYNIGHMY